MGLLLPLLLLLLSVAESSFFQANDPRIRIIGRTVPNGSAVLYDWSSVTIEAMVTGPVTIDLTERLSHGQEYLVTATGGTLAAHFQLNTSGNTTTYSLLPAGGPVLLRVEKTTEGRTDVGGVVRFAGLTAAALHALPPARTRRIQCIGDSIMCGNHAERYAPYPDECPGHPAVKCTTKPQPCPGKNTTFCLSDRTPFQCDQPMPHAPCPPCPPPPPPTSPFVGLGSGGGVADARESSHLSWCPVLARALDADYEVICESGNGLIMTDGGACATFLNGPGNCIPDKYNHRLACALDSCSDIKLGMQPPAPWAPDAVLINLGQNDYGAPAHIDPKSHKHIPSHLPTPTQWTDNYELFLKNITAAAKLVPGSKPPQFFLACGGMSPKYCANTQAAVAAMNAKGQSNVHYLDITNTSVTVNATVEGDRYAYLGCGGHPSWLGHAAAAKIAEPQVKAVRAY